MGKPSRKSSPQAVSEIVRRAVLGSGETLYRVSKDSGVTYSALHSFITGKQMLSLKGFDKLCAYLGLVLKPEREEG
jgi:hypothetical protein